MTHKKPNSNHAPWRFRREITFGTVLHLLVLLAMVVTTWTNLQKELALIRHDLTRLIITNQGLQQHIASVTDLCREHECRLQLLEQHARPPRAAETASAANLKQASRDGRPQIAIH